jgi:hypothetical protein
MLDGAARCAEDGPTCSDHFQPGSYVAAPIVMPAA